jgi:hypothetical protein
LLAVTILGISLANQKTVAVGQIINFFENIRVVLLSSLFTVLAARLSLNDLGSRRNAGRTPGACNFLDNYWHRNGLRFVGGAISPAIRGVGVAHM